MYHFFFIPLDLMSLKEGWITKQGQIRKNWKLRYFVLYNDGKLEYFKSEEVNTYIPSFILIY